MKTLATFLVLCVLSAWIPAWQTESETDKMGQNFPGWESAPLPVGLAPLTPGKRETRFAAGFPGRIGTFTDGARTYVVRWVRLPTRKLHPAADCLRALGYAVKPAPIFAEAGGTRWGTMSAWRDREQLRVRENIVDPAGQVWTDVSAWFWSAALGKTRGPWWAVTIFEAGTAATAGRPPSNNP